MFNLTGILLIIMAFLLQIIFSYYQIKHISSFYCEIIKKYEQNKNYFIGFGRKITKFSSLRKGEVAIVVIDKESVVNVYKMSGITVFAKFKPVQQIRGENINEVLKQYNKNSSICAAINNVLNKINT